MSGQRKTKPTAKYYRITSGDVQYVLYPQSNSKYSILDFCHFQFVACATESCVSVKWDLNLEFRWEKWTKLLTTMVNLSASHQGAYVLVAKIGPRWWGNISSLFLSSFPWFLFFFLIELERLMTVTLTPPKKNELFFQNQQWLCLCFFQGITEGCGFPAPVWNGTVVGILAVEQWVPCQFRSVPGPQVRFLLKVHHVVQLY